MSKKRKTLDFEVNLIPFIDLLSTCICFLLLTAVWVNVASMNVKQAVGGQSPEAGQKKPSVWVVMNNGGDLVFDVKDAKVPGRLQRFTVPGQKGKPNIEQVTNAVAQLKQAVPTLNMALIQPNAGSMYEDIIDIMDQFKQAGVIDLGVSPL